MFWSRSFTHLALAAAMTIAACGSVFAWSETPPAQQGSQPAAQMQALPGVVVDSTGATSAPLNDGTEIKIPGIGSVGVLPKLDFGLDLLYGSNTEEIPETAPKSDDVIIRGTLKHRF